ncbi:MAG TPA: hypothetical protein VF989_04165 [Polyangiaceae bacterium]
MMALNTLERIAALGERLGPLGLKNSGMRIEADDWNALVEVLQGILEIDRAQDAGATAALQERFALREHDHLGLVTTSWLDPELQARQAESAGSVNTRTALAEMSKKVAALGAEVARLGALLEEQQKRADRAATAELDRTRQLKEFDQRFGGIENLRTLVDQLSAQTGGLSKSFDTVLELRQSLTDEAGQPLDVAKIRDQVGDLLTLRDNLLGIDGAPLRMRDIELRLEELDAATGGSSLDQRLAGLSALLESKVHDDLVREVTSLQAEFNASLGQSGAALRGEFETALAGTRAAVETDLAQRFAAQGASLDAQLDMRMDSGLDSTRAALLAATVETIDQRLASLPADIQTAAAARVQQAVAALRGELAAGLSAELQTALPGALAPTEARVTALGSRLDMELAGLPTRIAGQLDVQVDALQSSLDARVDTSIAAVRTTLQASVTAHVDGELESRLSNLDARVAQSVTKELANLDARVSDSVAVAVRDLPDDIQREVVRQFESLDVPGRIASASAALTQQWRAELASSAAETRAFTSASVRDAMASVQAQVSDARRAAVDESLARSTELLQASEQRVTKQIDTKNEQLRESILKDIGGRVAVLSQEVARLDESVIASIDRPVLVRPLR